MQMLKGLTVIGDIGAVSGGWFRDDNGNARYKVVSGDNMNTLAQKYLGSVSRMRELWDMQSWKGDSRHQNDPNKLIIGDVMRFPADGEARAVALKLLAAPTVIHLGEADDPAFLNPPAVIPAPIPFPPIPPPAPPAPVVVEDLKKPALPAPPPGAPAKQPDTSPAPMSTAMLLGYGAAALAVVGVVIKVARGGRHPGDKPGTIYRAQVGRGPKGRLLGESKSHAAALKIAEKTPGGVVVHVPPVPA